MNTANLVESDSVAILRTGNAISNLPVYLDADNTPFVKMDGVWRAVGELQISSVMKNGGRRNSMTLGGTGWWKYDGPRARSEARRWL